ncbi:MAG TPA: aspartate aminotransferase family protein [Saprospirales bacterium]|nr:aspartate aminotransferase family protein [Saprospirales bacterium]HRQ30965.1 aminotransferase class III-fold pyridoxal phosphate-dependent enzyme [Saprospiraceae bacterium]
MSNLRKSFFHHVGQTSLSPLGLEVERAEGVYIFDHQGRSYIDLISGISVSSIGHSNPAVVKAVQEQAAKYMHTMVFGEHIQSPQVKLAEMLTEILPDNLQSVYFVSSGAEAVEGTIKLAKRYTHRYEIIACRNAYHGNTHGAQSLMSHEYFSSAYRPFLPGIKFIGFNDTDSLNQITKRTAAVFVEPVQGEAGIKVATAEFMDALRNRCDQTGTLLVLDEIQTGFGRTGKMFAFGHYGIKPDIVLMAKALGGGMPIGAFAAAGNVMKVLSDDPVLGHITSFGGHPVSAAAAVASLEFILSQQLAEKAVEKGKMFIDALNHPQVREIRSKGLLLALDLGHAENVQKVFRHAYENGVLTDWFLYDECSIRIAPPLIISHEEIQQATSVIREGLDRLV